MLDWQYINDLYIYTSFDREFQQSQQETWELWKEMANTGVDNDELEDEFAKYEQEVNVA